MTAGPTAHQRDDAQCHSAQGHPAQCHSAQCHSAQGRSGQRGFALLIVLWSLGLLSLLGTQLVSLGRQDTQSARYLMDAAMTEAAADGAVQQAIFRLLDVSSEHWDADDTPHALRLGPASVTVRIEAEDDRVNPNIASMPLLRALLLQLGTDPVTAANVAASIVSWRTSGGTPTRRSAEVARYRAAGGDYAPSGLPFYSTNDLAAVLGMTPTLLAGLTPHLTVFSDSDPTMATHDPVVARALGAAAAAGSAPGSATDDSSIDSTDDTEATFSVTVDAHGPGETRFIVRAVVRIDPAVRAGRYRILAFDQLPIAAP